MVSFPDWFDTAIALAASSGGPMAIVLLPAPIDPVVTLLGLAAKLSPA